MREPGVLCVELIPLISAWRELLQLGDLPLKPISLALQIVLGCQRLLQRLVALTPVLPQRLECRSVNAAIGVQHGTCSIRAGQALPGMLTMNVYELLAQVAQLRG